METKNAKTYQKSYFSLGCLLCWIFGEFVFVAVYFRAVFCGARIFGKRIS